MKRTLLVLVAVLACAKPQYRSGSGEPVLTVEGRVRGAPIRIDAEGLRALEQRTVRGRDPVSGLELSYEGASLDALLRRLDPQLGVDLVLVHGRGGYVVALPIPTILQHRPVIADRVEGEPPSQKLGERAGRLVLAWPNVAAPGFDADPRTRWWWPTDVTRVELVSWFETYGRALRVGPGWGDAVRRGSDRFATSCIQCHRVRNAGGTLGPELTEGIAATARQQFMDAVRAHPARVPELKGVDLTRSLPEIAAFLESVKAAGPLPSDETPEEKPREPRPDAPSGIPPSGLVGATRQMAQM
jgi:mono/diheme cytochrome c family protein